MRPAHGQVELTVIYEPAEHGWLTASIPAVPGTISTGRTREEARNNIVDALAAMLSTLGQDAPHRAGTEQERIRLDLSHVRVIDRDLGRGV